MAAIGSGTKVIPNIVGTGTWRPQDADQAFAALAEQLGGVAWSGGIPLLYGGNLDSSNFSSGMLLPSSFLAQPNAVATLTVPIRRDITSSSERVFYACAPSGFVATRAVLSAYLATSAGRSASGNVTVQVNGTLASTISVNMQTDGVAAQYPVVSAGCAHAIPSGGIISVDFSGVTFVGSGGILDLKVTLHGLSELIP